MDNFKFHVPTAIYFGKGQVQQLPSILKEYGKRVLLVYGGGSIKKIGLYSEVIDLLEGEDFTVFELAGVEPNPRIETVVEGAKKCHEHQIEVILAVGGGSVIDCAKVIGAAYYYDGDPWDFMKNRSLVGKVLPIVSILTLAATGSEMNRNAVISNETTNEKLGTSGEETLPKASILDPTYTFSVSKYQTAAGSADILSHLFENYFSKTQNADVQDEVAEGLMRTVIKNCPIALAKPDDYDARSNLMWSSTWALNGLTGKGKGGAWSCHAMEHVLSAHYDITHGAGLAILTPRWMKHILNEETVEKFARFAHSVWHVPLSDDLFEVALAGIQATYDYFESCELPMTLPEVGINEEKLGEMAVQACQGSGLSKAYVSLEADDVLSIYQNCLTKGI